MGLLQTPTERRPQDLDEPAGVQPRRPRFTTTGLPEAACGRHEPVSPFEGIVPRDPYAAWLQQREAEAEREREARPQIRLVHRRPGGFGTGIVARRL